MKSLFMRQFLTTTALLLVSFLLISSVFFSISTRYIVGEKKQALEANAASVAHSAMAYNTSGLLEDSWDFRISLSTMARAANVNILICDLDGTVILCSEEQFLCDHLGRNVGSAALDTVLSGRDYFSMGTLNNIYSTNCYTLGVAINAMDGNRSTGLVFVSTDASSFAALASTLRTTFLLVALVVLLLAFYFVTYTSRRQTQPLIEMADAAKAFAHGHLDVRVRDHGRRDEVGQLARAFNSMAESLEHTETVRREFVSNVSHELKTPLTTISGFVDGILDGTIPPEQERSALETVSAEASRLSRLIRSMLDVTRMQEKNKASDKKPFDVAELMLRTLFTLEQKINAKQLEVETDLPENGLMVLGVADSVTQVVYNLLDNAIKFSDQGGTLSLSAVKKGGKALVTVADTGQVIPPEQLPLVFDRFHKVDAARSADRDGVGLGLYIVKTILDSHGEDISVESQDGRTAFTFTMTLA